LAEASGWVPGFNQGGRHQPLTKAGGINQLSIPFRTEEYKYTLASQKRLMIIININTHFSRL
jgi:hypothetical protein